MGILLFKDSVYRCLETLLGSFFALAGPTLQLAIATLSVAQTVANWIEELNSELSEEIGKPYSAKLQHLPMALQLCADTMEN